MKRKPKTERKTHNKQRFSIQISSIFYLSCRYSTINKKNKNNLREKISKDIKSFNQREELNDKVTY